jgi:hypothetical protein
VRADGRTVPASAAQPAPLLEVLGHAIGHVVITRNAAAVIAPAGRAILPPLVALVTAHKATTHTRTEHRYGDVVLCVITTPTAVVIGCQGEHLGSAA